MPELPDLTIYLEALERRVLGQSLNQVRILSPFLPRTAVPPIQSVEGRKLVALRRLGKRIVFGFEDDLWLVLHLMIAGRLHWRPLSPSPSMNQFALSLSPRDEGAGREPERGAARRKAPPLRDPLLHSAEEREQTPPARSGVQGANLGRENLSPSDGGRVPAGRERGLTNVQAWFGFPGGRLVLTEAGTKKRAALHLVRGEAALQAQDPGGLEVIGCSLEAFAQTLTSSNHTLKRALTDPGLFSGIGNAYSDEILHRAQLSPVTLTQKLSREEIARLHRAAQETLTHWIGLLRQQTGDAFPENVTAFRPEMAVHGKFGKPCPACGAKVQRIRYAGNETNYCPACQTSGRLLADRSLSLLLRKDWPGTAEELEELRTRQSGD